MGKTSSTVKNRYNTKVYEHIAVCVPKELGIAFKAKCKATGVSQAQVVKAAIERFLQNE